VKSMQTATMTERAVTPNQTEDEETMTYLYGYMVALEPGEAAPDFADHPDVEVADEGWDKIERVHRFAYTTTNQEVAAEHEFALVDLYDAEEKSYDAAALATSWGTFDSRLIEHGDYVYIADDGARTPIDIYTDEGAWDALEAAAEVDAEEAAQQAKRDAIHKTTTDARDTRFVEMLTAAGLEPSGWDVQVALQAAYHVRDASLMANGATPQHRQKFGRRYEHLLYNEPTVAHAREEGRRLAQRLENDARNKLHGRATKILDVIRSNETEVVGLLTAVAQAMSVRS
jgi:hypothetical protein